MKKPIQLVIEDIKLELIDHINSFCSEQNIDYYFLEIVIKDLYNEISSKKEKELDILKEEYLKNTKGVEDKDGNDKN